VSFALHLPINSLSFGQTSVSLLREIKKRGFEPCLFPIGQVDLSAQKVDQEFVDWLNVCVNKAGARHSRKVPIIKLWHLNDSLSSYSDSQILLSFYECDAPTPQELNTIKNNKVCFFTNKYTVNLFQNFGLDNVRLTHLSFDSLNFPPLSKNYLKDRIQMGLAGKFEFTRKQHLKVLRLWASKFGNNPNFFLNCAIFNPFMKPEDQQRLLNEALGGRRYFNIQFLGFMPTNELYNDYLQSNDIIIGMGTEGWGLPEFKSVALGKHAVLLNCAGYKEWANNDNAVLVEPNHKFEAYDGLFFHRGQPYNQGNFFGFDDQAFLSACDIAIERTRKDRVNHNGLKLQGQFTVEKTVDTLLSAL